MAFTSWETREETVALIQERQQWLGLHGRPRPRREGGARDGHVNQGSDWWNSWDEGWERRGRKESKVLAQYLAGAR